MPLSRNIVERFLPFLNSRASLVLSGILLLQILTVYAFSREELVPDHRPLRQFPAALGDWVQTGESVLDEATQEVLRADEVLSRSYRNAAAPAALSFFVAYFKSQRTGVNPHSPKNCLPGAGWYPLASDFVSVEMPGRPGAVRVNRYVIAKGDVRSLVLYWYQSRDRVIASEYAAKLYLVADAIRHNRTETALVRITVPFAGGDLEAATRLALDFAGRAYPALRQLLPG